MGAIRKICTCMCAAALSAAVVLCGCTTEAKKSTGSGKANAVSYAKEYVQKVRAGEIASPEVRVCATGASQRKEAGVTLDDSNADEGYIMLRADEAYKVRISKGDVTYTYNLPPDAWCAYVLSEGAGAYSIRVLKQVKGTTYRVIFETKLTARMQDDITPFLYPSQYVAYDENSDAVLWSFGYCAGAGASGDAAKTDCLYAYTANNIQYDYEKAETVVSGYLPDVDETLQSGKGICFDYSSLLCCMLRVQGVPTKLVTGYVGPEDIYHAWNLVYEDGEWIWMDPTMDGLKTEADYTADKQY